MIIDGEVEEINHRACEVSCPRKTVSEDTLDINKGVSIYKEELNSTDKVILNNYFEEIVNWYRQCNSSIDMTVDVEPVMRPDYQLDSGYVYFCEPTEVATKETQIVVSNGQNRALDVMHLEHEVKNELTNFDKLIDCMKNDKNKEIFYHTEAERKD